MVKVSKKKVNKNKFADTFISKEIDRINKLNPILDGQVPGLDYAFKKEELDLAQVKYEVATWGVLSTTSLLAFSGVMLLGTQFHPVELNIAIKAAWFMASCVILSDIIVKMDSARERVQIIKDNLE